MVMCWVKLMISLTDSLQYFKGIGPRRIKLFNKLGISSIEDLLYYFPYRYEDRSNFVSILKVLPGQSYTLKAKVLAKSDKTSWKRRGFHIFELVVGDDRARIFAVWFNQPYLKSYFKIGQSVILYGKAELYKDRLQIVAPEFEILENGEADSLAVGRIVPIYSLSEGITQRFMRQIIKKVIDKCISKITDPLPYNIRKKHNLLNLAQSLINIHFPKDNDLNKEAYRRLAFEEFFFYQIPVILRKLARGVKQGISHKLDGPVFSNLIKSLTFSLTSAQIRVLEEIKKDMSIDSPMQRLLEGEVGSGKTIVALLAIAIALDGGYQVAFMVPTEILARQHFINISRLLRDSAKTKMTAEKNHLTSLKLRQMSAEVLNEGGQISLTRQSQAPGQANIKSRQIEVVLLISGIKKNERDGIYRKIRNGKINLVVGTHALIQENLSFKNLGLVIIDEQHKFGVAQRGLLSKKGSNPDTLIMTATPIPRTLSMTIYGDLDISVIDELPKGRKPVKTIHYPNERIEQVYDFIRTVAKQKRQVYVVCPVIDESREQDLKAAETIFKEFEEKIFKEFKIGLVHGQLDTEDADRVMQDFRDGHIDILVATSVLEVGIDVPGATCMVVLQAERFGLSQLHQLRGRVGRGELDSFFIVVSSPKTQEAKKRIKAIEEFCDGFRIAEEDLRIRGPGEFFGRRQHGLSTLKIANPLTQLRLLKSAREEVCILLRNDPCLSLRQNQEVLSKIKRIFPEFPRIDITI